MGIILKELNMGRSIRQRGLRALDTNKLIFRLFFFSLLLFVVLGFGFGIHSAFAKDELVLGTAVTTDLPIINKVVKKNANDTLFPPKVVTVVTNSSTNRYLVFASTVRDVINATETYLDYNDLTIPDLNAYITNDATVRVIDVDIVTTYKDDVIPFKTIKKEDNTINTGTEVVSQKGSDGILKKTIRISYHDGITVKSEIINEEVIVKEVNEIILVGTKPFTIQSCKYWGKVVNRYADPIQEKEKNRWMKFIMQCETGCDSGSRYEHYFPESKGVYGLYQFTIKTFNTYNDRYYKDDLDIWDGTDQIKIVSKMYETEGNRAWHWPACNSSYLRAISK